MPTSACMDYKSGVIQLFPGCTMSKGKPTTTPNYVKPPLAATFNPSRPSINMSLTVGGPATTCNIEQLCNVFYHGEYHRAITLSNTLQHDLLYTLLTVLNVRARSLAQCGRFEQAMQDANFMMEQAPTLAVGYLCGGWIYAMQGRQQAAIEIYTLGLDKIQPETDEESYAQLQQGKMTAELQQSKRIDFIAKLPFDILPNVVSRFFYNHMPGEHVYYLDISRTWRDRIYQCTKHSLRFIGYQLADNYTRLVEAAPYVSELAISSVSHAPNDVLDQLRHGSFRSLRVLKLTCKCKRRFRGQDRIAHFGYLGERIFQIVQWMILHCYSKLLLKSATHLQASISS